MERIDLVQHPIYLFHTCYAEPIKENDNRAGLESLSSGLMEKGTYLQAVIKYVLQTMQCHKESNSLLACKSPLNHFTYARKQDKHARCHNHPGKADRRGKKIETVQGFGVTSFLPCTNRRACADPKMEGRMEGGV